MRMRRWCGLIAGMVILGCLQVAQRNALYFQGYAVGEQLQQLHTQETSLAWMQTHVVGLVSPTRLARVAQERRLNLVAWSALDRGPGGLVHMAAAQSMTRMPWDATQD